MPIPRKRTLKAADSKVPRKVKSKARRKRTNLTSAHRGPYKLTDQKIREFTTWVAQNPEMPLRLYYGRLHISKETYNQWRHLAEAQPGSIYARFMSAFNLARNKAWENLQKLAERCRPHEVLFRLHSQDYPSERLQMELSGSLDVAVAPVSIELHCDGAVHPFTYRDEHAEAPPRASAEPSPLMTPAISQAQTTAVEKFQKNIAANGVPSRLAQMLSE